MNVSQLLFIGLILMISFKGYAQEVIEKPSDKTDKHTLYGEIAGRTFIFSSINYEYKLEKPFSIGVGLGLTNFSLSDITRNNNGASEEGRNLEVSTTQMVYGNYFIGKRRHKFFLTAGLTNLLSIDRRKYPSENEFFTDSNFLWNAGVGYQLIFEKTFLRITGYCISFPEASFLLPKYIPWLGVSGGIRL